MEPNHSNNVGQNTIIINGVPEPARNRNGVDKIIKIDARSETLLLNHRFNKRTNRRPKNKPIMMLGSLMEYGVRPKIKMDSFWTNRYGKSTTSPCNGAS